MIDIFPGAEFLGRRVQIAFVVRNIDEGLAFWTEKLGVKRFVLFEANAGKRTVIYKGAETKMDMSIAYSYLGDAQIEILSPRNDEPSPYTDFLNSGRSGLHHLGFWPDDYPAACAAVEKCGFEEVCAFYTPDGEKNASYYDSPDAFGAMLELVPMTKDRGTYFPKIRQLAESDEFTERVLRFPDRQAFLRKYFP